eukprot:528316_1
MGKPSERSRSHSPKAFETEAIPLIGKHNIIKKYVDDNGDLDSNTLQSLQQPIISYSKDMIWHKAFVCIDFKSCVDIGVVWTEPAKNTDIIFFSINDCEPYKINLKLSIEEDKCVYIP